MRATAQGMSYHLGMPEHPPIDRDFRERIGITDSITISSRHYMAAQHLWSARHQARQCAEINQVRSALARNSKVPGAVILGDEDIAVSDETSRTSKPAY
jgi:hypothetical protein